MKSNTYGLCIFGLLLNLIFTSHVTGQSAYHGGKGDGFDKAATEQAVVGRAGESPEKRVEIYPQPVSLSQALTINLPADAAPAVSYRIHDPQGSVVQKGKQTSNSQLLTLHLKPDLTPGIYLLELKMGVEAWRKRVVVVNE